MKRTVILLAATWASLAGAAYRCVDEKGLTHIGDTPPAACAHVMLYEVSPSGTVIRKIEPTPTPEQVEANRREAEKRRADERAAADQKRKDMALLSTYTAEREFDVSRDKNIDPIRARIAQQQERLKAIEAREKKIAEEMEFYKAGKSKAKSATVDAPPPMLVQEQERLTQEKAAIAKAVASLDEEIAALRTRYDNDKRRWVELKTGVAQKPVEGPKGPTTVTLSAGAAGRARCGDKVYECPAGETYICYEQGLYGRRAYKVNCVVERK